MILTVSKDGLHQIIAGLVGYRRQNWDESYFECVKVAVLHFDPWQYQVKLTKRQVKRLSDVDLQAKYGGM